METQLTVTYIMIFISFVYFNLLVLEIRRLRKANNSLQDPLLKV